MKNDIRIHAALFLLLLGTALALPDHQGIDERKNGAYYTDTEEAAEHATGADTLPTADTGAHHWVLGHLAQDAWPGRSISVAEAPFRSVSK